MLTFPVIGVVAIKIHYHLTKGIKTNILERERECVCVCVCVCVCAHYHLTKGFYASDLTNILTWRN